TAPPALYTLSLHDALPIFSETAYEVGAVLGVAVLGGILTASYRAAVAVPGGVQSSANREAARETLGAAMDVAGGLNPAAAEALVDAARAAVDHGVPRASAAAILIALAAAAVAAATLRRAPRD